MANTFVGLFPSVVCRGDFYFNAILEAVGPSNSKGGEKLYRNLTELMFGVLVVLRNNIPKPLVIHPPFKVRDTAVALGVTVRAAVASARVSTWLARRHVHVLPKSSAGDSHDVGVLFQVSQIGLLAQQFLIHTWVPSLSPDRA